jgi:hypothetical protein
LSLFLLAQESNALLFCIQGYYHKQTQNHKKEENFHAPRIARRGQFVLCSEFANAKQLCKYQNVKIIKNKRVSRWMLIALH